MSRRDRSEVQVGPPYPWRLFWALLVVAAGGFLGALPYAFEVMPKLRRLHELPMPVPIFIVAQLMQSLIIFGLVVGVGLLLAPRVGLRMPILRAWLYGEKDASRRPIARVAIITGLTTAAVLVALFYGIFIRYLPGWPSEATVPIWKRLLACVYGALNEELLLRLFLLALVLWLAGKITRIDVTSSRGAFWFANILVALIFGVAHLPVAADIVRLTPIAIFAVVGFNAAAGIVFGYLAWSRGLEAAIVAHFSCDLVIHLVGPLVAPV